MRRITVLMVAVAAMVVVVAGTTRASREGDEKDASVFVTKIPSGYRDWKFISVAHEEGNLNSFAAILGNDLAIKAYREGKLPFPDGAIIAALHYRFDSSEENNKVFGRAQSFVAGRLLTFSSWSRTQRSTPLRGAGRLVTSTMGNLPARR